MASGVAGCGVCWTMQLVRAALPLACLLLLLLLLQLRCLSLAARRVLCAAALVPGVRVSDWVRWRRVWLAVAYAGRCRVRSFMLMRLVQFVACVCTSLVCCVL